MVKATKNFLTGQNIKASLKMEQNLGKDVFNGWMDKYMKDNGWMVKSMGVGYGKVVRDKAILESGKMVELKVLGCIFQS